ncbi:MAG: fibronectin type III-like domain-contianing protein, partial [Alphaproteobacteria bacterium]
RVTAANPNCVVVMNSGGAIDMSWLPHANAALQSWFGGQEYGNALAALIFADECPSAKMPTTFPQRLEDTPAFTSYPGENGKVRYGEGLYVGYRWYDKRLINPAVPFGHGLSYADFAYRDLDVKRRGENVIVSCTITNKSARDAQEIVQVYVGDEEARLDRPLKELKGFAKVMVPAGGTVRAEIILGADAFSYWDDRAHEWVLEPGTFTLLVGASSRDIRLSGAVTL